MRLNCQTLSLLVLWCQLGVSLPLWYFFSSTYVRKKHFLHIFFTFWTDCTLYYWCHRFKSIDIVALFFGSSVSISLYLFTSLTSVCLFLFEAFQTSPGKRGAGRRTHPGPRRNQDHIWQYPRHLWGSHQNQGSLSKWPDDCDGVIDDLLMLTCFLCVYLSEWSGGTPDWLVRGEECRKHHPQICELKQICAGGQMLKHPLVIWSMCLCTSSPLCF